MTDWTSGLVAETLQIPDPAGATRRFRAVSTDTRALTEGDLFVALSGERFDGHDFLEAARDAGASGAVVCQGTRPVEGLALFEVEDTLPALHRLASRRREDVTGPVVGITGTNGKTATKELLARALGVRWSVHATRGSLNNEIGVPLTILAAPDDTDALVVEAGASERGEIERLRRIIAPTAAIITNVSTGHVEGFGSLEAVLEEKLFILHGVNSAVVGTDPPDLIERARALGVPTASAGLGNGAEVRPDSWCLDGIGRPELVFRGQRVRIPLLGRHQGENAMLVLALAEVLGLDIKSVAEALETVTLPDGRCQLLRAGGLTVLNDSYNANPASFAAALETAAVLCGRRPLVVIVGTMLELGPTTIEAHESVADAIVAAEPAVIGALGAFVPAFERHHDLLAGRLVIADEAKELGRRVASRLVGSEFVLLKASRGVQLERALPHILPNREAQCSTTS